MNTTSKHVPFEMLTDLADQRANADERSESERTKAMSHVSACTRCASELQRLEHVMLLMKTDREPDAPRDLIAYAMNIFDRRRESKVPPVLRRLVAALRFDSNVRQSPAYGVRSGQLGSRQLLYSAEGNDVEVRITPQQDHWVVAGQVLGQDCLGGEVNLVRLEGGEDEQKSVAGVLNELCEFNLAPVPPGSYKLRLWLANVEVEIPQLELEG